MSIRTFLNGQPFHSFRNTRQITHAIVSYCEKYQERIIDLKRFYVYKILWNEVKLTANIGKQDPNTLKAKENAGFNGTHKACTHPRGKTLRTYSSVVIKAVGLGCSPSDAGRFYVS